MDDGESRTMRALLIQNILVCINDVMQKMMSIECQPARHGANYQTLQYEYRKKIRN
jgi:hypothetical protein